MNVCICIGICVYIYIYIYIYISCSSHFSLPTLSPPDAQHACMMPAQVFFEDRNGSREGPALADRACHSVRGGDPAHPSLHAGHDLRAL